MHARIAIRKTEGLRSIGVTFFTADQRLSQIRASWTLPPATRTRHWQSNTSTSHTHESQQRTEKMESTLKRKKPEVPSFLDKSLDQVLDDAMETDIEAVKKAICRNNRAVRELSQDPDLMSELIQFMKQPPSNRPVDKHETVFVVKVKSGLDDDVVTMALSKLPGFVVPCVRNFIDQKFVMGKGACGEFELSESSCLLDLLNDYAYGQESEFDVVDGTQSAVFWETHHSVCKYVIERWIDKKNTENTEDEGELNVKKLTSLLRCDPSTLDTRAADYLHKAFTRLKGNFCEEIMMYKASLFDKLTELGPVQTWHLPPRCVLRVYVD